jgi:hypothetical protein
MPFLTYLYKTTLESPRSAEARKAAYNAVVHSFNEQAVAIQGEFGRQDWVVVLWYVFLFLIFLYL